MQLDLNWLPKEDALTVNTPICCFERRYFSGLQVEPGLHHPLESPQLAELSFAS